MVIEELERSTPEAATGKRRHVWMITPGFYPAIAGEEIQVRWLGSALMSRGFPAHVLTRRHVPRSRAGSERLDGVAARENLEGIDVIRVFSKGKLKTDSLLFLGGTLKHLLFHGRKGIYSAHDIGAAAWAAVIARYLLGGYSIVKMPSGVVGYRDRLSSPLSRWRFSLLLKLVDHITVVNSEVEQFVQGLGVPASRVTRIPNMVDTSAFKPASDDERVRARSNLGIDAHKKVVLSVGRLTRIKGLDVLLNSWAELSSQTREKSQLILVGGGSEEKKLREMSKSLGISDSVAFPGIQPSIGEFYAAADLFVLPSRSEGLSLALIEAMASGLPVVASRVGGAPDVISEGKEGMLFESENIRQLTDKLALMLESQEEWSRYGSMGRQSILNYANMDETVDRLVGLFE